MMGGMNMPGGAPGPGGAAAGGGVGTPSNINMSGSNMESKMEEEIHNY